MLHIKPYVALTISYTYNLQSMSLPNKVIGFRKGTLKCLHNYLNNGIVTVLTSHVHS